MKGDRNCCNILAQTAATNFKLHEVEENVDQESYAILGYYVVCSGNS